MAGLLRSAAAAQPLAVFVDDLHRADVPSARLLQFLAGEIRSSRLLVVAAHRDNDLPKLHPLREILAALRRESVVEGIRLDALSEAESLELIRRSGATLPNALVELVARQADGNPFFILETLRHIEERGSEGTTRATSDGSALVPEGVRQLVIGRATRLSEPCRRALGLAAVIDLEFDASLLEEVWAVRPGLGKSAALSALLDEAEDAGFLARAGDRSGRYRFRHGLIREVLRASLAASEQVELHRAVAQAIEHRSAASGESHFAPLAFHFHHVASAGHDADKAIEYARAAAREAMEMLAYEEAARLFGMALGALDTRMREDEVRRCELLLELGRAQWRAGRRPQDGGEALREAAAIARRLGLAEHFARAALGSGGDAFDYGGNTPSHVEGGVDRALVELLEEALARLPEGDSATRVRLMAKLSRSLYTDHEAWARRMSLAGEAIEMARRLGDPACLAWALVDWLWGLWPVEAFDRRIAATEELERLCDRQASRSLAMNASFARGLLELERGEPVAATRAMERARAIAKEMRDPVGGAYCRLWDSLSRTLEGRYEEAERMLEEEPGAGVDPRLWLQATTLQLLVIREDQGRLAEIEPLLARLVDLYPSQLVWPAALAWIQAETGAAETACAYLEAASGDLARLPRDDVRYPLLALLARLAWKLGASARASELYECLLPLSGRVVVATSGPAAYGPVDFHLGLLAETVSDWHVAIRHHERALSLAEQASARTFVLRCRAALERARRARRGGTDAKRADSP